jgi:hypothetical protein
MAWPWKLNQAGTVACDSQATLSILTRSFFFFVASKARQHRS